MALKKARCQSRATLDHTTLRHTVFVVLMKLEKATQENPVQQAGEVERIPEQRER